MAVWDKRSAKLWLLGIISVLCLNIRQIMQNKQQGKPIPTSLYLQITINLLDILIPGFKLDYRIVKIFARNKGIVGLAGVIGSLISIYLMYPKR